MSAGAERLLPVLGWLRSYRHEDLPADLRAGATVGVLIVPQSMAYAALAGLPPIAGLYAATVSLVVYAALGTSRFISVGPVAIDSLLTAAAVGPIADGDTGRYVALAAAVAVLVGTLQVSAGLLRLGALVNFLSVPVVAGFTSAAALTIAVSQVKDLLGLDVAGGSTTFLDAVETIAPALPSVSWPTAAIGAVALALLLGLRRWFPRVPGPLVVVVLLTAVVWSGDLPVRQVGQVPSGVPLPGLPDVALSDLRALLPAAAAIALISYLESISTGQVFARRTRTRVEPDQELVAVGLSNAAAGLVQGMPVAGGFSRGAVNVNAGARSQLSGVVASLLVLVSLLLLTPVLAHLPMAALAAIIVVAVIGLVDVAGARAIGRVRPSDLVALGITFTATLVLGPAPGLGVGVVASLVLFLRHMARPHVPRLGLVRGGEAFRNVARHDVLTAPELLVARVDAPLSFASARPIADRLADLVHRQPSAQYLVLDCSAINTVDYTGAEMLMQLNQDLEAAGVTLHLAALRGPVSDVLRRTQYFRDLEARGRVHRTVPRAVRTLPVELA